MKSLINSEYYKYIAKLLRIYRRDFRKLKKNIIINGGSGFISSQLIFLLFISNKEIKTNFKIYVITRNPKKLKKKISPDIYKTITIIKESEINKINANQFFYFASPANHSSRKGFFLEQALKTNIFDLKKLLSNQKNCNLVFLSSNAIQQNNKLIENEVFDYEYKVNERVQYDLVKILSEFVIENSSKNYFIIRPDLIFGPGESLNNGRFFSDILYSIIKSKVFKTRASNKDERSFMFIIDFLISMVRVVTNEKCNNKYIIGNYLKKYKVKKLIQNLSKSYNFKSEFEISDIQKTNPTNQIIKLFRHQKKSNIVIKTNIDTALKLMLEYYKKI